MQVGYFIGVNRDYKLIEIPVLFESETFKTREFFEDVLLFDLFINQQRYFYKGFNPVETHAFNNNLSVELVQERYFRTQGESVSFTLDSIFRTVCCDFESRIPTLSELAIEVPMSIVYTEDTAIKQYEYNLAYNLVRNGEEESIPTFYQPFVLGSDFLPSVITGGDIGKYFAIGIFADYKPENLRIIVNGEVFENAQWEIEIDESHIGQKFDIRFSRVLE
ncbi:structural protein [Cellulophaga phage Omtje_3]|uniref:Structural protein n=1 Tax=Cellulophaga phage Omtje_1 TaxID=2745694 RepID=A0A8E4ZKX0_9VIRU|nr:structural protein [Cellulophaga phage Omtje_1]QQV90362.1 structural protein [Cellulophaga phage Omtje_2]QQV90375.1 structural protein [Cellulophaga phage Omtje_3]QQV90388.1 structural protein [Cellulophaga phage Omtje_4]QQV90401.1 structural protein [Cellulophaga phage Omtje_5]